MSKYRNCFFLIPPVLEITLTNIKEVNMLLFYIINTLIATTQTDELQQMFDIQQQMKDIPVIKNLPNEFKNNVNRYNLWDTHDSNNQKFDQNNDNQLHINNDNEKNVDTRRTSVLQWFKGFLAPTTTTTEEAIAVRTANQTDLMEVLQKLTSILDNINKLLIKATEDGFLTVKIPLDNRRFKRNVNTTSNLSVIGNNDTVVNNETVDLNNTILSGRRSMSLPSFASPATEIKNKLLYYLEETFTEIQNKLQPLNNLKVMLSDDNNYKIGYLAANIDTLQVNLNKMRVNMDENKHFWDDSKILELFDKLKSANKVITKLLGSLSSIVPNY